MDKAVNLNDKLNSDVTLNALMGRGGVKVLARRKSRYSTMKKIIRDGRKREEVHDLLGIDSSWPNPGAEARFGVGQVFSDATYEEMEARVESYRRGVLSRAANSAHDVSDGVGRAEGMHKQPETERVLLSPQHHQGGVR